MKKNKNEEDIENYKLIAVDTTVYVLISSTMKQGMCKMKENYEG
jgi:hypothetical protein